MKRLLIITTLILLCLSLTSCELVDAFHAAKYAITGDIIEPADDFSTSDEKGTLIYKGNKYIYVDEIGGDCRINIPDDYIFLGYTSNFPFFPYSHYYGGKDENTEFICGFIGGAMGTFVYLREDLYNNSITYVLNNSSFEFEFASAFIKTDKVNYDDHVIGKKYTRRETFNFYMKEIPVIEVCTEIYLIENTWYHFDDTAYQLSDELVSKIMETGAID